MHLRWSQCSRTHRKLTLIAIDSKHLLHWCASSAPYGREAFLMCPVISIEDFAKFIEGMERPFWEPIGHFVFRFGMLERKVDEALSDLMGTDYFSVGMYPLADIDFSARVNLLNVFSRGANQALRSKMKTLTKDLIAQATYRNNLVHGP